MHRITFILILSLFIPDLYIYFVYIAKQTHKWWLRCLWWLPTIVLTVTFFQLMYFSGHNAMSNHPHAIGLIGVTTLLFTFPKITFMLFSIIGIALHGLIKAISCKPFIIIGYVLASISFCCILYGATLGISHFDIKEINYYSNRLPKGFNGYRIVQISDLHLGSWRDTEIIEKLVTKINKLNPDLIVFTGDLVNQQSGELNRFKEILAQLHAKDGVYSVLGNHDYGDYYRWENEKEKEANLNYLINEQKNMGWKMLNNEHVILRQNGDSIALIGVENDGEPPFSQHADLSNATQSSDSLFSILLSHNPTHWRREVLPKSNIDLMLSGHTHAMQVIIAGYSLSSLIYPEWAGIYYEGKRALYVNIGIGYVGFPFRFGAWPEITVFTLHE